MRSRSTLPALALCLLLLAGVAQAEPWLQSGAGPARANVVDDEGPAWPDVAWEVPLPGTPPVYGMPVVIGATAYVGANGPAPGIYRVGLDDASLELHAAWDGELEGLASDGTRLIAYGEGRVAAFLVATGELEWEWSGPAGVDAASYCGDAGLATDAVYVPCSVYEADMVAAVSYISAIDITTGRQRWLWKNDVEGAISAPDAPLLDGAPGRGGSWVASVAVLGPMVVATGWDWGGTDQRALVWAIERETGYLAWTDSGPVGSGISGGALGAALRAGGVDPWSPVSAPTGAGSLVYAKLGPDLVSWNLASGERLWSVNVRDQDVDPDFGFVELTLDDTSVYVPAHQTLTRIDARTRAPLWQAALDPASGQAWDGWGPILANGRLYASSGAWGTSSGSMETVMLRAYDAQTGAALWELTLDSQHDLRGAVRMAVADGRLLMTLRDARLMLLGPSAAAIDARAEATTRYPAPGEEVQVDLSGTAAGLFGAATQFRADWGDGTASAWSEESTLRHTYSEAGDHEARFFTRNEANQTSSQIVVFHVGAPEPNLLSVAFARENQETTFFVLGLALTGAGAGYGAWRVRRRHRELRRELEAMAAEHAALAGDPDEQERRLARRRERAHALVLARRLDESQAATIDRRALELVAQARMLDVEEQFAFLPYSLVRTLRAMLRDGRINAWEHEHILRALDEDVTLTPEQKALVRARLDAWSRADQRRT